MLSSEWPGSARGDGYGDVTHACVGNNQVLDAAGRRWGGVLYTLPRCTVMWTDRRLLLRSSVVPGSTGGLEKCIVFHVLCVSAVLSLSLVYRLSAPGPAAVTRDPAVRVGRGVARVIIVAPVIGPPSCRCRLPQRTRHPRTPGTRSSPRSAAAGRTSHGVPPLLAARCPIQGSAGAEG